MLQRYGLGPVFALECALAARRWQTYALRATFLLILLLALTCVWSSQLNQQQPPSLNDLARSGQAFFFGLIGMQLTLLLLGAPAATAGAVCLDKARGTLLHLLVTDLSNVEIILGKLAGRLVPTVYLLLGGVPVLAVASLIGGILPEAIFGAFAVSLGVVILGCAFALALSVWAGRPHEVLLVTYLAVFAALLAWPIAFIANANLTRLYGITFNIDWLLWLDPFVLAYGPYTLPGRFGLFEACYFLLGCCALASACCAFSIATLRTAARWHDKPRRKPWILFPTLPRIRWLRPSLDFNPVLWREWSRRTSSVWLRYLTFFLGCAAALATAATVAEIWENQLRDDSAILVNTMIALIGWLFFCISAVSSLVEERIRGSLDVLLTTPLTTRSIVWGKWYATYRRIYAVASFPAIIIVALALRYESWPVADCALVLLLAHGAFFCSLGLALATWVSRPGRAAAWCVGVYALINIGLPMAMELMVGDRSESTRWVLLCSPMFAIADLSDGIRIPEHPQYTVLVTIATFWIVAYFLAALVLQLATLSTFERCLGRVRQRTAPPSVVKAALIQSAALRAAAKQ